MSSESTGELSTTESEGFLPVSPKHHGYNRPHFSSATRRILGAEHDQGPRRRNKKGEKDSEIMMSLDSISSQLGILISKMETPSHMPVHTYHPLPPPPPDMSVSTARSV